MAKDQSRSAGTNALADCILDSVPISIWVVDFTAILAAIAELKASGTADPSAWPLDHPEPRRQAGRLIKVVDLNRASVELCGAADKDRLLASIDKVIIAESIPAFREAVLGFTEGRTRMALESIHGTLDGRKVDVLLDIVVPGEVPDFSRVIVSVVDITKRKLAEAELRQSQAFLEAIIENLPDMVFVKDAGELRFVRFNRAGEELLGYGRDDLIGKNDYDFFPKSEADFFTGKDREVLAKGKVHDIPEEPIHTREKGLRWLHTKKVPIPGLDGRPRFLLGISEDITEHKRARQELFEKSRLLNAVTENTTDVVFAKDRQGRYLFMNRSGLKNAGKPIEEILGRTDSEIFNEAIGKLIRGHDEGIIASGQAGVIEVTVPTVHGPAVFLSAKSPLVDEDGQVAGVVGIARDITERKRSEQDLARLNEELARSNRELQNFAYVASHDLQEPLRKVRAFGDRLEDIGGEALGEKGRDYLQRMLDAATRMSRLIDDLLEYSRVGTKDRQLARVDLRKVLREVVTQLELRLEESHGRVEVGELPVIEADRSQMQQLFLNLVGNALKFRRKDVPPLVRVSAAPPDEGNGRPRGPCEILVEDNGVGFEERYAVKIFGVFQRLHGPKEYPGSGIGLAICKRIVDRHGGSISASSNPGEGSVFKVVLPYRPEGAP